MRDVLDKLQWWSIQSMNPHLTKEKRKEYKSRIFQVERLVKKLESCKKCNRNDNTCGCKNDSDCSPCMI